MNKLQKARNEINEIDEEMIKLFKRRMSAVRDVISYKIDNDLPILDAKRESEIMDKNLALLNDTELEEYYRIVFNSILTSSKLYQEFLMKAGKNK